MRLRSSHLISIRTTVLLAIGLLAVVSRAASPPVSNIPEPSALRDLGRSVLDEKSAAQQKLLGEFARHYQDQMPGVLAHLTLGYSFLQAKNCAEAKKHFAVAGQAPSLVQDYAVFHQALCEAEVGNQKAVAAILEDFPARYPLSVLAPNAVLQLARSHLASGRPGDAVAALTASKLSLPQPDATYLLGQAYQRDNRLTEAVAAYRQVFYHYPASPLAKTSEEMLNGLRARMSGTYPAATAEMWSVRADKLYAASRWREALSAYQTLTTLAQGRLLDHARVRTGAAHFHLNSTWPALNTLQKLTPSDPDAAAERLYIMAAAYRRLGRRDQMEEQIATLGKRYPKSSWHAQALILGGNYYLLEKQFDRAGDYYRMSYQGFPQGTEATLGHWKVAWQAYRERRWDDARHLFEEHVQSFPASGQVPAALYWLARLMEKESPTAAAGYYKKITEAFPNFYYGLLARQRLTDVASVRAASLTGAVRTISLDHIQRTVARPEPGPASTANEGLHRERVRLLESAWLMDWAIEEMRSVVAKDPAAIWAGQEMARLERERGRLHLALRYAKRYVPSYFAQDLADLSRDTWELLFPRPYWEELKKQAAAAKVDPFLVAGLIRQESEFDPNARSRSNARGLMQLMPATARMMSRRVPEPKAQNYQLAKLYVPDINMVYGTHYLKKVLDQFSGTVEYALAGYNAGENRVVQWLQQGPFDEPAEFVESIPFTETREYVQAVLRNAAVYRELYPEKN